MTLVGTQTYSATFNSSSGKLTLSSNTKDFTVKSSSTLGYAMGMTENTDAASSSHSVTFPNIIDLSGPRYICLVCPNIRASSFLAGNYANILCSIPVTNNTGNVLCHINDSARLV